MFSLADDSQYEAIIKRSRFIVKAITITHAEGALTRLEPIRGELVVGSRTRSYCF